MREGTEVNDEDTETGIDHRDQGETEATTVKRSVVTRDSLDVQRVVRYNIVRGEAADGSVR